MMGQNQNGQTLPAPWLGQGWPGGPGRGRVVTARDPRGAPNARPPSLPFFLEALYDE